MGADVGSPATAVASRASREMPPAAVCVLSAYFLLFAVMVVNE